MFKKLLAIGFAAVTAISILNTAVAADAKYKEGVNYQVRAEKLTEVKEIREFFSFWCGHCFSLQETFDNLEKAYPNAEFVRNPVAMLGGPMGPESQRALVVAKNLGMEDIFVKELFKSMHTDGKIPMSHAEMADFMATVGIAKSKYEKEYISFPVMGAVAKFDKWAKDINIDAVPEILINGKYLVTMESVQDEKDLFNLIGYLLEKDGVKDAKSAEAK